MELEFPAVVASGIFTEPEVKWWFKCTAEEMGRMGSTTVRYLMQRMLTRPYTLECIQQALVSGTYTLLSIIVYTQGVYQLPDYGSCYMLQETSRTHNTLLLREFYFRCSGFSQLSCCPCQGEQLDYQRYVPIFARLASVVAADTSTRWPATCINDTLTARLALRLPLPSLQPICSSPSGASKSFTVWLLAVYTTAWETDCDLLVNLAAYNDYPS